MSVPSSTPRVWQWTLTPPQPSMKEAAASTPGVGERPASAVTPLPSSKNPVTAARSSGGSRDRGVSRFKRAENSTT
ncbi:MAG: hypothetical protein LJU34_04265 [Oscillospiraceae bacterium]|nr:hypothetical protein [Oscillospiraceae bacterium]